MNRERWMMAFWIVVLIYVGFYVGGQAMSLLAGWLPQAHKVVETPTDPYQGKTPVEIGAEVFHLRGCQACHQLGLVGGVLGPSMSNVGGRRSEDWLYQQLEDPQVHVPGNFMPSYHLLTQHETDGLVTYLKSLDGSRQGPETGAEPVPDGLAEARPAGQYDSAMIDKGQTLFINNGCGACHTIARADGAAGVIGPNLTREGWRGRTDDWQKQHLKDPLSVYTSGPTAGIPWPMTSFDHLSDGDLDALVAYLQSLR